MATKKTSRATARTTKTPAKTAGARPPARRGRPPRAEGLPPEHFAELVQGVREMKQIMRGELAPGRVTEVPSSVDAEAPDAGAIRSALGLSQAAFADLLGISRRTLEGWEQGRRLPDGPARVLLRVAAKHPAAVLDVVRG